MVDALPTQEHSRAFQSFESSSMTQFNAPDTSFLFITDLVGISGKVIVSPQVET